MATIEEIGLLTVKDDSGNQHLLYPVTKTEAVDGLYEALSSKVNTSDIVDNLESTSTVLPLSANQGNVIKESIDELKKSVSDGKSAIASAITAKGVSTASDATFETMASNISNIATTGKILTSVYHTGLSGWSESNLQRTITPNLDDGNYVFLALWGYHSAYGLPASTINTFAVDGTNVPYVYDRTASEKCQICSLIANITLTSSSSIVWTATYTDNPIIRIFKFA